MNILLDTHTILWFLSNDERLSDKAKNAIMSAGNNKFVTADLNIRLYTAHCLW